MRSAATASRGRLATSSSNPTEERDLIARTIDPNEVGLIVVPFIAKKTTDNNLEGMEDSLVNILDDDVVIRETLCASVKATGVYVTRKSAEAMKEELRERSTDAAAVAAAVMSQDKELLGLIEPWMRRHRPWRFTTQ